MDKSKFVLGGAAWINLLNTQCVHNKEKVDLLADPATAAEWLEANRLLPVPLSQPDRAPLQAVIAELVSLRSLCTEILVAWQNEGRLTADLLMRLKTAAEGLSVRMTLNSEKEPHSVEYEGTTAADYALHRIISSVFETLETSSPGRVRKCEYAECILHFVDTSKSGKRRWCSMELCGNRHKAASFYGKAKQAKA